MVFQLQNGMTMLCFDSQEKKYQEKQKSKISCTKKVFLSKFIISSLPEGNVYDPVSQL